MKVETIRDRMNWRIGGNYLYRRTRACSRMNCGVVYNSSRHRGRKSIIEGNRLCRRANESRATTDCRY